MYGGNGHFQYSKGNNSKSRKTRVRVNVFCMSSHGVNICIKFHEDMSSVLKIMERTRKLLIRGKNSKSRKTTVMVHVFCTSSYGV